MLVQLTADGRSIASHRPCCFSSECGLSCTLWPYTTTWVLRALAAMCFVTNVTAHSQMMVHRHSIQAKEHMEGNMRSFLTALFLTASIPAFADCGDHGTAELGLKAAQAAVDQYHGKLLAFDRDKAQSIISLINTAPPKSDFTGDRVIIAIFDLQATIGVVDGQCMAHYVKMRRDVWEGLMKEVERAFV
jgi:hypothetical protein